MVVANKEEEINKDHSLKVPVVVKMVVVVSPLLFLLVTLVLGPMKVALEISSPNVATLKQ